MRRKIVLVFWIILFGSGIVGGLMFFWQSRELTGTDLTLDLIWVLCFALLGAYDLYFPEDEPKTGEREPLEQETNGFLLFF